jgi:hypothetical protein
MPQWERNEEMTKQPNLFEHKLGINSILWHPLKFLYAYLTTHTHLAEPEANSHSEYESLNNSPTQINLG